jgi:hypothetical protein
MEPSLLQRVGMSHVEAHTPERLNRRIHEKTVERMRQALQGGTPAIERRLRELDREWDVERALETTAATFTLTGIGLTLAADRRWLALPAVVAGFLLQHAVQGWCPPLPVVRALGFRTQREIEAERHALKAARGDFDSLDFERAPGPNTLLAVAEL